MIGFLRGILEAKSESSVLVDVEGVGYHVAIPATTSRELPAVGEEVRLFTHLHVRENALDLYGFLSLEDRGLFLQLISVTDVGPKTAMNVMSGIGSEAFREAITHHDVAALTQVSGVGKKTAERLVLELKDKIGEGMVGRRPLNGWSGGVYADVTEALVALGYTGQAIREALRRAQPGIKKEMKVQDMIKHVLRYL